ncbi:condensation domain-containing protein [Nonomuraea sp. NPDC003754]
MTCLLPAQRRWVGNRPDADWHHFNLGWLFTVPAELTGEILVRAVERLLERNPALRTAYRVTPHGWRSQVLSPQAGTVMGRAELADYRGEAAALAEEIARAQTRMRPADGQVLHVVHFPFGDEPGRLLVIIHHLTLDGFSMGIVADELESALRGELEGPRRPATPADYVAAVEQWVRTEEAAADARRWRARPFDAVRMPPTDRDEPASLSTMRLAGIRLSAAETAVLARASRARGLRVSDVVLDAAAQAIMARWGLPAVGVDTYHVGRHLTPLNIDVVDTVGYLQNTFPIVFTARDGFDPADLRAVPERLFGFDALRHFTDELADLPKTTLRYNFRGQLGRLDERAGALLRSADEPLGPLRSQVQTERYTLMLEGDVVDRRLELHIKYSTGHYHPGTVRELLEEAVVRVRAAAEELTC